MRLSNPAKERRNLTHPSFSVLFLRRFNFKKNKFGKVNTLLSFPVKRTQTMDYIIDANQNVNPKQTFWEPHPTSRVAGWAWETGPGLAGDRGRWMGEWAPTWAGLFSVGRTVRVQKRRREDRTLASLPTEYKLVSQQKQVPGRVAWRKPSQQPPPRNSGTSSSPAGDQTFARLG